MSRLMSMWDPGDLSRDLLQSMFGYYPEFR